MAMGLMFEMWLIGGGSSHGIASAYCFRPRVSTDQSWERHMVCRVDIASTSHRRVIDPDRLAEGKGKKLKRCNGCQPCLKPESGSWLPKGIWPDQRKDRSGR